MTGASGCIGHYLAEALIQQTDHYLYLLVRNPDKLQFDYESRPGVTILPCDLRNIEQFRDILPTMDMAILAATAWGGPQEIFDINIAKTIQLVKRLDPKVCQQVFYFSTASILDRENQLLKEARHLGTDYIRSKYECYKQLEKLAIAPQITVVFPTLVFGGEDNKPPSHLSAGLRDILKWINLVRFFQIDASFHFIHARDIARVICHLIESSSPLTQQTDCVFARQLILGQEQIPVNQAIQEICSYLHKRIYFRLPLSVGLANWLIGLLRLLGVQIYIATWDKFCMQYRHFTYKDIVNPTTFGLPSYCATIADLLKISGINY